MSYLLDSDIGLLTHFKDLKVYYIKKLKKTKDTVGIGSDMLSAFDKGEPIFCRNQNGESSGSFYLLNGSSRAFALVDLEESKDTAEYAISEFRKRDFENMLKRDKELKERHEKLKSAQTVVTDLGTFDFSKPTELTHSNTSFIQKGIVRNGTFVKYYEYKITEACNVLKKDIDNEDYMFFIPVQWCNFSKYDSNFVLNWVDTVSKTFDIPVTYFGIHTFDNFKPCENVNKYLTDNAFYTFHISGEEHYMMRYLLFNCLRYLYHTENNNIPGLTMQMMSELGTTNFFLCLLLAHCNNIYNEYWGIGVVERNNFYAIPNPDANLKTYLSHIIKYKTISHNIERLKATKDDLTKFDKLVNEKRFAQLLGEVRLLPKEVIKQKQEQKKPSFKKSNPAFFVKIQDPVQGFAAIGMEQANHIDIIPIEDRIYSKKRSIRTAYAIIVGGTVVFVPTSFYNLWTTISNSELNGENRAIIKSQLFANLIYIDNVAETQQDKKEAQPIKKKWNNFIK